MARDMNGWLTCKSLSSSGHKNDGN